MVGSESHAARQASNDISCATLEGADLFLLTHETSIGKDPAGSTIQTAKAIMEAERIYDHKQACANAKLDMGKGVSISEILCSNAMELALENKVSMMVVITENGYIARMLARQRPQATILACSV
jgi:pyruvate kinase